MSGSVLSLFKDELRAYDTSRGTIRFPANAPLPAALLRKIVKAHIRKRGKSAAQATKEKARGDGLSKQILTALRIG
jgi:uncharacterized protein YdhG (YjbR/CyaY superfamily)